jgi:hypothetical protein
LGVLYEGRVGGGERKRRKNINRQTLQEKYFICFPRWVFWFYSCVYFWREIILPLASAPLVVDAFNRKLALGHFLFPSSLKRGELKYLTTLEQKLESPSMDSHGVFNEQYTQK